MKPFVKNTASSCLGSLIAFSIIILIIFLVVSSYTAKNKPNQAGILHIPIQGNIQDFSKASIDFNKLEFSTSSTSLWSLSKKIKHAEEDPKISGIFLDVKSTSISQQTVTEISQLLTEFKATGKKIYAYSYYYDQNAYLLSTVADSMYLNPNGGVDLKGYALFSPLFKSLLDELDIEINIYYAGKYKSGTEPYRLDSFTAENKFQYRTYFNQLRQELVHTVAKNRGIDKLAVDDMIKSAKSYDAKYILEKGFVDRLYYNDEFNAVLERDFENAELVPISTYKIKQPSSKNANTAIVFAEGEIMWGQSGVGSITYGGISKSFKEIAKDDKIKNVILRINSPGGNGYTSDLIYREIEVLKESGKKVYASLGPYATSGGYYIAAACDSIFAEENTLTGSIGVYIMLPSINRFLKNKARINVDSIATDKGAIPFTPFLSISEEQSKQFIDNTEKLYEQFLSRVSKGRGMPKDSVHAIAQGRVWSGKDAKKIGLVDHNMGLTDLIRRTAGENPDLKIYPKQDLSLPEQIIAQGLPGVEVSEKSDFFELKSKVIELQNIMKKPEPAMKIPFDYFVMIR
jgi:protease-4